MKKLYFIVCFTLLVTASFCQDVIGSRVIAKNSLFVRDRWIDTVTVDTTYFQSYNRSIPTAGAVYDFVVGRVGSGGGGSSTWGLITGTLSNQTDLQNALNLKANLISPLFTTPRLNSTSTTGYVWTATDAIGNGSFQAIPNDNLLFDSLGNAGISPLTTWNNTLYSRRISISGGTIDTTASGGLLITVPVQGWGLTGNAGTSAGTNFIGTTDAQDFVAKVNNVEKLRLVNNANSLIKIGDDGASGTGILLDYGGNNSLRLRNTGVADWYFSTALKYRFTSSQIWVPMIATGPTFFTATALNHVAKGTTTVAPFKFTTAGSALTLVEVAGQMEVLVDSIYYTGSGAVRKRLAYADEIISATPTLTRNLNLESITAAENKGIFYTPVAITITEVRAVSVGSSPSVTYNIAFGSDRTSGTNVFTSGQTTTSTTTGDVASGVNDNTIPAGSYVWLTTSAAATPPTEILFTITYTED